MTMINGIKSSKQSRGEQGCMMDIINCSAVSVVVSFLWWYRFYGTIKIQIGTFLRDMLFSQHLSSYDWVYMLLVVFFTTVNKKRECSK